MRKFEILNWNTPTCWSWALPDP